MRWKRLAVLLVSCGFLVGCGDNGSLAQSDGGGFFAAQETGKPDPAGDSGTGLPEPTGKPLRDSGSYPVTAQVVGHTTKPEIGGDGAPAGYHYAIVMFEVRSGFADRSVETSNVDAPVFVDARASEDLLDCPEKVLHYDCDALGENFGDIMTEAGVLSKPYALSECCSRHDGEARLSAGQPYYMINHTLVEERFTATDLSVCYLRTRSVKSRDCAPLAELPELPPRIAETL